MTKESLPRNTTLRAPAPASANEDNTLVLKYDGEAYQGEMDATELAQVISSLDILVDRVVQDMAPGSHGDLKIKAFVKGSFEIVGVLEALQHANVVLSGGGLTFLGVAVRFYWKNMRRVATSSRHIPERGVFEVTWLDGEVTEMTEDQWRLYNDKRAKKAMRGIAKPLSSGAAKMELVAGGDHVTIPASEAPKFELPPEPDLDNESVTELWAQPDTVSFDVKKNWRLTNREIGSFSAKIEDARFKAAVAEGRTSIRSNDSFKVRLRTEVSEVDGSVKTKHFIEEVLEHHEGMVSEQDELPQE